MNVRELRDALTESNEWHGVEILERIRDALEDLKLTPEQIERLARCGTKQ
jgi:hypothetical protein